MTPGQVAYETWAKHSTIGKIMDWDELGPKAKDRWEEIAQTVLETFMGHRWDNENVNTYNGQY